MANPVILDLDKVAGTKRIIKLSGKEIDVSKIPSRVTLEMAENADAFKSGGSETFPKLLDMIVKICKPSTPDITKDWLVDNTDMEQLLQLIEFILAPIQDRAASGGKGNKESPGQ